MKNNQNRIFFVSYNAASVAEATNASLKLYFIAKTLSNRNLDLLHETPLSVACTCIFEINWWKMSAQRDACSAQFSMRQTRLLAISTNVYECFFGKLKYNFQYLIEKTPQ